MLCNVHWNSPTNLWATGNHAPREPHLAIGPRTLINRWLSRELVIDRLYTKPGKPLCLIGDSETGTSHLLIALGTEAAMAGHPGQVHLGRTARQRAGRAADEKALAKTIARYGRVDLLCIDELGYMQLDRQGAELLFQVLTEREEKASVAIASNESFGGWTKTFTDPRLCATIVDRLTFGGTSWRPAPTPTASPRRASKSRANPLRPSRNGVGTRQHHASSGAPLVSEVTY